MLKLLDEFCHVASYLNITRAAAALNMSQPNLSRHLRQLERELGFNLLVRQGGTLALTGAGRKLADEYPLIRQELQELFAECNEIARSTPRKIVAHEAPYMSDVVDPYYDFLKSVSDENTRMEFRVLTRISLEEALHNGVIDVGVAYAFFDQPPFPNSDYEWTRLCKEVLGVWVDANGELASKDELSFCDISDLPLLMPNDPYHPTRGALLQMFEQNDAEPKFIQVNTKSRAEFMTVRQPGCALIYPLSMTQNPYLRARSDLCCVPLDRELSLNAFAVWRKGDSHFTRK